MSHAKHGAHRLVGVALAVVLAASVATACAGSPAAEPTSTAEPSGSAVTSAPADQFPVTIVDAAGQSHTYDEPVANIGCNWVGCLEALADLGVPVNAASAGGIENSVLFFPQGPPKYDLDKLGGAETPESWGQTDVEVIGDRGPEDPALKALKDIADMFYLYAPGFDVDAQFTGPAAYEENLRMLGKITGKSADAEAAIERFQAFVDALKAKAPAGAENTTVSALLANTDGTYNTLPASSAFCVALEENALGRCAMSDKFDADTWQMNAEAYLAMDPDWIAYTGSVDYNAAEPTAASTWKARTDPVWKKLSAVKAGHVYDTADQMHCCGLRSLAYHLQDYAFNVWGPASGVTDPGILGAFDPRKSTLAAAP